MTMAQALIARLAVQRIESDDGQSHRFCDGVWAIFGHGNVAALGEALAAHRQNLPVYRAHNEQAMAHSAIAYGKASFRRRIMAVTTSIGPGATNLVTAAALAHVNRLPVLLLPGDVFASRDPDPVLQQLENSGDGTISVNDCFKPVTRYFDRITRPEQILTALPRALSILTDPAHCGPVCLALPQDVQAESFDCPEWFLQPAPLVIRRQDGAEADYRRVLSLLTRSKNPMIIAGGGVLYSLASTELIRFAERFGIPVGETQGGKSALPYDHPLNLGGVGVTGSPAANDRVRQADLILAVGSRLSDFTTGSQSLFGQIPLVGLNVNGLDADKMQATSLVADARLGLVGLEQRLGDWRADSDWTSASKVAAESWRQRVQSITTANPPPQQLPYEGEVIGAVRDSTDHSPEGDIVVCAAGTLPAELQKLWQSARPGSYHVEYGYSCMGYEIAGGIGVKMAQPESEVVVMVGDGSYLMMNSEIATSVMLGVKLLIVLLDNRGFGCINRLQKATAGENFNNLLVESVGEQGADIPIDFVAHARALGAEAVLANDLSDLRQKLVAARRHSRTSVVVIKTSPWRTTEDGGCWWEVAPAEVSSQTTIKTARQNYLQAKTGQRTRN